MSEQTIKCLPPPKNPTKSKATLLDMKPKQLKKNPGSSGWFACSVFFFLAAVLKFSPFIWKIRSSDQKL